MSNIKRKQGKTGQDKEMLRVNRKKHVKNRWKKSKLRKKKERKAQEEKMLHKCR